MENTPEQTAAPTPQTTSETAQESATDAVDAENAPESAVVRLPVSAPGFSGPLELLVHLISKHEFDVCSISISAITQEYLDIINNWENKDLDLAGEYLVLAAALIRYKARALIPREETEPEEEEISDQVLEQRRREYERFRELANRLRQREEENADYFPRVGPSPEGPAQVVEYTEVSVYDLFRTFQKILEDIGTEESHLVAGETYSVDEKILEIEALIAHNSRIVLSDYLITLNSKLEIIVVFLALLEMIRLREIRAMQESTHGEIFLEKGEKKIPLMDEDELDDETKDENGEDEL
ncbi:MAG: segregation/condensation protein A [Candidatus Omnitrophota bacterium]